MPFFQRIPIKLAIIGFHRLRLSPGKLPASRKIESKRLISETY